MSTIYTYFNLLKTFGDLHSLILSVVILAIFSLQLHSSRQSTEAECIWFAVALLLPSESLIYPIQDAITLTCMLVECINTSPR